MKKMFYLFHLLFLSILAHSQQQNWTISGNSGLKSSSNFLGTRDATDLVFKTNAIEYGRIVNGSGWRFGIIGPDYASFDSKGNLKFTGGATHLVSPNQFGLLCNGEPGEGLYMNGNPMQWEYRGQNQFPFFTLNTSTYLVTARGGLHLGIIGPDYSEFDNKGNLRFTGNSAHLVKENQFALLCDGMPSEGLYVNGDKMQWEFTDTKGQAYFTVNSATHDIATIGGVQMGNSGNAVAGNMRWNGDGFQGFDGKNWRTFMFADLVATPSTTRTTQQQTLMGSNESLQDQVKSLQKQVDELRTTIAALLTDRNINSQSELNLGRKNMLEQNVPNPFSSSTLIPYTLPAHYSSAQMEVTDAEGKTIQRIKLTGVGKGSVRVKSSAPSSGTYRYSLIVDGKVVETRQMLQVN